MRRATAAIALAAMLTGAPALADGGVWAHRQFFPDRTVAPAGERVSLTAPRRSADDRATPVGVSVALPMGEVIARVSLIVDDNPAPLALVVDMQAPMRAAAFDATLRMNGPSMVRAIVETEAGAAYEAATLVKTSGVGACAAPPGVNAAVAMATLGEMTVTERGDRLALTVSHPSYSGMQMDQVTLLYTPARYVETVAVSADGAPLFTLTGSISLSENPRLGFDRPPGARTLQVRVTDTGGAVFDRAFALGGV